MNSDPQLQALPLHFERIRGFIDLGLMEDAWRELDAVPLNARHDLGYRWLCITASLGLEKYFEAAKMVGTLCSEYPEDGENWLFLAELLVKVGFLNLAVEVLTGAQEHSDLPDIRYELAANLCASGSIEEGREKLEALLVFHPQLRAKAKEDPRFKSITEIFLKDDE